MGLIDRFLNRIKLNDDFDEDDDFAAEDDFEDDFDDEDPDTEDKPKKGFFSRFSSSRPRDDDDDFDDPDDEEEEYRRPVKARKTTRVSESTGSSAGRYTPVSPVSEPSRAQTRERTVRRETEKAPRRSKVTPIRSRSKNGLSMEVNVIRPSSMEDTREIADTLMDNCTVVLNLEGLDVDMAQRIIDFTCGCCYALDGSLQKVSSYIFILTPSEVDISGDYQSILSGAFDLPSMKAQY